MQKSQIYFAESIKRAIFVMLKGGGNEAPVR